jgi:redox-sensitive bicupin YhaK (pirin superfamily)
MTPKIYKSNDRGSVDHGWLKAFHSFSFGEYHDPARMGFGALRVLNEDRIEPGQGFGRHGHRDMEIITVLLAGELKHSDSLGNGSTIRPGVVQYMSAGTGVLHSEVNPSLTEKCHLLQIWIEPNQKGLAPRYGQIEIDQLPNHEGLKLLASPEGAHGSITLRQDARLYLSTLAKGQSFSSILKPKHGVWIQILKGSLRINGEILEAGDGMSIENDAHSVSAQTFEFSSEAGGQALVFEL